MEGLKMRKRKSKNRLVSLLLCMMMIVTMIPVTGKVEAKANYVASDAIDFAKMHCSSGHTAGAFNNCTNGWLCAEFVSKCLINGGLGNSNQKGCRGLYNELSKFGTPYLLVTNTESGCCTVNANKNPGKISVGDVLISYCPSCNLYKHATLVSSISNGYVNGYEHNGNKFNKKTYFSKCSKHNTLNVYAIHFENSGGQGESQVTNSNIWFSEMITPTGNLSQGQMFGLYGTISSTYKLSSVTAEILNSAGQAVQSKSVNPNNTSCSMRGPINDAMIFNALSAGSYTFRVTATDIKGYSKNYDSGFSVGSAPIPNINVSSIWGVPVFPCLHRKELFIIRWMAVIQRLEVPDIQAVLI